MGGIIYIKNTGSHGPKKKFTFPCTIRRKKKKKEKGKGKEVSFCPLVAFGKLNRKGKKGKGTHFSTWRSVSTVQTAL